MFSLRKKKQEKRILKDIFPKEINLYDVAHCNLVKISQTPISSQELEQEFKNNHSIVFNFSGEIFGQALAVCSSETVSDKEKDIFQETVNIILGKFLSFAEESMELVSHLSSPIVFRGDSDNDRLKGIRTLSVLNQSLRQSDFHQFTYEINFTKAENYPTIVFNLYVFNRVEEARK